MNGMANRILSFQLLSRTLSIKRFGSFSSIRSGIQGFTRMCVVCSSDDFHIACTTLSRTLKLLSWECSMVGGIRACGNHELTHNTWLHQTAATVIS